MFAQAKLYALLRPPERIRDSLIAAVQRQRERLTPYDQAFLDHTLAARDWNFRGMLHAARRMTELAPRDAQAQLLHAQAAIWSNHFSEAVEVMHREEPVRGWLDDANAHMQWDLNAHHYLGDFEAELREVTSGRHGVEFNPCRQVFLLRPLAALGREMEVQELIESCDSVPEASIKAAHQLGAAGEYGLHGHPDAAARALELARGWYERNGWTAAVVSAAFGQRDWNSLTGLLRDSFDAGPAANVQYFGIYGVAAANVGDTAAALDVIRRLDRRFERVGGSNVAAWSALVTAALGRKEEALLRLHEVMELGFPQVRGFHGPMAPALDPLLGEPRFEAMRRDRR